MAGLDGKRKLIDKYEIPLNHLDFVYIRDCKNAREMEKIVHILRSGEEGYFPDLTKCAEDKLRELKPNSRLFRYEEQLRSRDTLSKDEWKPMFDWTTNIKKKDSELSGVAEKMATELYVPPVRKSGVIQKFAETDEPKQNKVGESKFSQKTTITSERIKSTDYGKWDKYDADEECLRMELAEERAQEEVERKNRMNKQKSNIVDENNEGDDTLKQREVLSKLTAVERERLAEEYRLRGNDYFRAKEYDNAVKEYDRAITVCPEKAAAAYNNRAASKIKLKWYSEAIKDCQKCLQLEPDNIKASLRLAEATYCDGSRQESYPLYLKVLDLDPHNAVALKAITQLKNLYGELPPQAATRINIVEDHNEKNSNSKSITKKDKKSKKVEKNAGNKTSEKLSTEALSSTSLTKTNNPRTKPADYDLTDLIKPNRIVKNKLATAAAALSKIKPKQQKSKALKPIEEVSERHHELILPTDAVKANGNVLIEEI